MGFQFVSIKKYLLDFLVFLFILLFVYASVSKLVDYETFENQLGQSPLLSAFASLVAPGVIISELIVALLLIFERTRFDCLVWVLHFNGALYRLYNHHFKLH